MPLTTPQTSAQVRNVLDATIATLAQLRRAGWQFVTGRSTTRYYGYVKSPSGVKRDVSARNEWALLNKYLKAVKALQDQQRHA